MLYVIAKKKKESTSDYNLVAENIFVQLDLAKQECMTLPTLPTPSNMHCMLKWKWNAVSTKIPRPYRKSP